MNPGTRPIPLRLAVHLIPPSSRTGKAVHVSVLYRWKNRGLLSPEGVRTRLRTVRIGPRVCVTPNDLKAFLDAIGGGSPPATDTAETTKHRAATSPRVEASRAVDTELDQAGF